MAMEVESTDMFQRLAIFTGILLMISQPSLAQLPWYEGGTLQKGTVSDWRGATSENQLATSADFIASLNGVKDIGELKDQAAVDEIRQKADELQGCINQSIQQPNVPPERPIAEVVVRCTILKPK
jgi:hypothetical protein